MAIPTEWQSRLFNAFKETTPGQPTLAVCNKDGSNVVPNTVIVFFSPDSPLPTGPNEIGRLQPNQSINLTQVNGVSTAPPATNNKSSVASSITSVNLLAANLVRQMATIYNDSTQILYLDLSGGTASTTSYSVQVASQGYFELPLNRNGTVYTGLITGLWAAANGSARITETLT